jgi:hypothetical protein
MIVRVLLLVLVLFASCMFASAHAQQPPIAVAFRYRLDPPSQPVPFELTLARNEEFLQRALRPERSARLLADVNAATGAMTRPLSASSGDRMILAETQNNQEFYCVRERLAGLNQMLGGGQRMWQCFTDDQNDGVFDRGGMLMNSTGVDLPRSGFIENVVPVNVPYAIDSAEQTWSFTSSILYVGGRRSPRFLAQIRMAESQGADRSAHVWLAESANVRAQRLPATIDIAGARLTILAVTENSVHIRVDNALEGDVVIFRAPRR